jgi:hypothetical protein
MYNGPDAERNLIEAVSIDVTGADTPPREN